MSNWCIKKHCDCCSKLLTITADNMTKERGIPSCPRPYDSVEAEQKIRFYTQCHNCGTRIEVDAMEIPENIQQEVVFTSR